ncbi:MAG: small subunit ribosomal protein S5 [Parcubacteria group bacterium Athens0714_24]|nr:MAG: small subunit ribosomal protein S5 [Parcubacteria group bacterium Athens0714_24]
MARFNKNQKSDLNQKIIDIRRVTRVVAGGKRFNFRVTVVTGNRNGEVGMGIGKSSDTASAIDKAVHNAKKNMIKIRMNNDFSIPHESEAKFSTCRVILKPARQGRGLVAGGAVRTVLDLAGVKNISAKILSRSKNKINNAMAAIKALKNL